MSRKEVLKAPEGYYFTKRGVLKKIETEEVVGKVELVEGEQVVVTTEGEIMELPVREEKVPKERTKVDTVVIGHQGIDIYLLADGNYEAHIWVSPRNVVTVVDTSIDGVKDKLKLAWDEAYPLRREAGAEPREAEEKIQPEEEVVLGEPEVETKEEEEKPHYDEDENVTETVMDETPDEEDVSTTEQEVYGELPVVEEEEPSVEPVTDVQEVVDEPVTEKPAIEEEKKPAVEDERGGREGLPNWLIPLAGVIALISLLLM